MPHPRRPAGLFQNAHRIHAQARQAKPAGCRPAGQQYPQPGQLCCGDRLQRVPVSQPATTLHLDTDPEPRAIRQWLQSHQVKLAELAPPVPRHHLLLCFDVYGSINFIFVVSGFFFGVVIYEKC